MKILFVSPPIQLPKVFAHYPMFSNIGMLTNAALARAQGHEVSVLDALYLRPRLNYRPISDGLFHVGAELVDIEAEMKRRQADVVVLVITMFSDVYKLHETYFKEVAEAARRSYPKARIMAVDCYVCGMNYFPYDPQKLMKQVPQLDSVLTGEADFKLIAALAGKKAPAAPIADLDELPYPAYDLLDMDNYQSALADAVRLDLVHEYHKPERFLALMTSRGCKYSCSFCTQQVLGMPWRGHSVGYLKKMILDLRRRFKVERFFFLDNNINLEADRFQRLTRFLAAKNIAWDAVNGFRADRLTKEDIGRIKRAGNTKLTVSAESGDPRVLSGIVDKRLDLKSVIQTVKDCQAVGLPSQVHYIIGMPGEDKKQMNRTLEFAQALYEIHGAWPLLQHAIPFRGTALYRSCEDKGWFAEHPDKLMGWALEQRPVIKTDRFTPQDVLRMKELFKHVLDALDTVCVLDLGLPCNNSCRHCEVAGLLGQGNAGARQLLRRLRERKQAGARDLLVLGGEPTLEPGLLVKLAGAGRAAGYVRRCLATNARSFVYKHLAERIVGGGMNQVSTALNSLRPDVHDAVTNVPGSFVQTVAGIRNLRAAGLEHLDVTIRITAQTLPTLVATIGFLKDLGLRSIHLRFPAPLGKVASDPALILPFAAARPVLSEALSQFADLDISVQGMPFCLMPAGFRDKLAPLPVFQLGRIRPLKSKPEECLLCTDYIACLGFYRQEYERYYRQKAARR
ncbi:MAG: radical SAM protein [Elusimicrobia bacterium]|nr:radical SAM protein [Elusimicrobiota bacterium]